MAIRSRKPTSPARRFQTSSDFSEVTKSAPEKSLLAKKSKTGGRNTYGRKTARHRGGGGSYVTLEEGRSTLDGFAVRRCHGAGASRPV